MQVWSVSAANFSFLCFKSSLFSVLFACGVVVVYGELYFVALSSANTSGTGINEACFW